MADRVRQAATGIPRRIRRVQAHPGGLDEAVPSEIHRGHRPPPAGADAGQAPGYGAVNRKILPIFQQKC